MGWVVNRMNNNFVLDYERANREKFNLFRFVYRYLKHHYVRYLFWGRLNADSENGIIHQIAGIRFRGIGRKYGLEMNMKQKGGGIRLIHPYDITVNDMAIIGQRVTLYKGCTIGEIVSGAKRGCPTIGNDVTIYANATLCGNIQIGNDVEIAAGSFVNFNVPDNSIVIGNPGTIHTRKNVK